MAFEECGFCVVRGPELLLGGDIRNWHAIRGKFDGVIGGPPCQTFSDAVIGHEPSHGNLIPEFERIVEEAAPLWFVMENVAAAPAPRGAIWSEVIDAWECGSSQHRNRRFSSNLTLDVKRIPLEERHPDPWPTVLATEFKYSKNSKDRRRAGRKVGRKMTMEEVNLAMGLPEDFATPALTMQMSYRVRGNGVPLELGRAIAEAVKWNGQITS